MKYSVLPDLVQLPLAGPGYVRKTSDEYMTWGHPELISAIEAACANCVEKISQLGAGKQDHDDPSLAVVVKDLNTADGKASKGHKTHGAGGNNVDIGYFYTNPTSGNIENLFINHKNMPYRAGKTGRELIRMHPQWHAESNWQMTLALLGVPSVSQIMVDKLYAEVLEARAAKHFVDGSSAGDALLKRALRIIQWYGNHDNHFHLTIKKQA